MRRIKLLIELNIPDDVKLNLVFDEKRKIARREVMKLLLAIQKSYCGLRDYGVKISQVLDKEVTKDVTLEKPKKKVVEPKE